METTRLFLWRAAWSPSTSTGSVTWTRTSSKTACPSNSCPLFDTQSALLYCLFPSDITSESLTPWAGTSVTPTSTRRAGEPCTRRMVSSLSSSSREGQVVTSPAGIIISPTTGHPARWHCCCFPHRGTTTYILLEDTSSLLLSAWSTPDTRAGLG